MNLPIVYRQAAKIDYIDGYTFYHRRSPATAERFAREVQVVIDQIATQPEFYAIAQDDIREAMLKDFPFCIYFVVESDRIRILSVFHTKRDPQIWQGRR